MFRVNPCLRLWEGEDAPLPMDVGPGEGLQTTSLATRAGPLSLPPFEPLAPAGMLDSWKRRKESHDSAS